MCSVSNASYVNHYLQCIKYSFIISVTMQRFLKGHKVSRQLWNMTSLTILQPEAPREVLSGWATAVQDLQHSPMSTGPAHLQRPPVSTFQHDAIQGQVLQVGSCHQQRYTALTEPGCDSFGRVTVTQLSFCLFVFFSPKIFQSARVNCTAVLWMRTSQKKCGTLSPMGRLATKATKAEICVSMASVR